MNPIISAIALFSFMCCTTINWGDVKTPSTGKSEAIGSYAAGCMAGGETLPLDGPGYQVMRPSRNRFYGQTELVQFIKNFGSKVNTTGQTILIGDMSQPRGGYMKTGHGSHQIGLDVDIWFTQIANRQLSEDERENMSAQFMADENWQIDFELWKTSNVQALLKTAAEFPEVDRIFVNPAIKQQLCKNNKNASWLYKIRPWWEHREHFHVRLKCPADNPDCVAQAPLPKSDGCDESLAWWFSDEAKAKRTTAEVKHKPFPMRKYPDRCEAVLNQ